MSLGGLIVGGRYELVMLDPYPVPEVTYVATDVRAVERRIEHHHVSFDIRFGADGKTLAYHMGVPDLRLDPSAIAIAPKDEVFVMAGQAIRDGIRTTIVDDKGRELRMDRFTTGLQHDLTHLYARAYALFTRTDTPPVERDGQLGEALRLLADATDESRFPAPYWLMGRCLRARGELNRAVLSYLAAVHRSTVDGERFIPFAAGPLTDLGVALKKLGDVRRARLALQHALRLRPNHPEALLTLAALSPDDRPIVDDAVARSFAVGGQDEKVELLIANIAASSGGSVEEMRARGRAEASRVDLARWPFATAEHEHLAHFVGDFEEAAVADEVPEEAPISAAGVTYRSNPPRRDPPVSDPGEDPLAGLAAEIEEDRRKPWWKIW